MTPKVGSSFLPSHVPQGCLFLGGGEVAYHQGIDSPSFAGLVMGNRAESSLVPRCLTQGGLQHGTKWMGLR